MSSIYLDKEGTFYADSELLLTTAAVRIVINYLKPWVFCSQYNYMQVHPEVLITNNHQALKNN